MFQRSTMRVTEKTIDVQTRKVLKGSKWVEETIKTETLTNERGSTTKSKRTTYRDLANTEIPSPAKERKSITPPESAPRKSQPPTPSPAAISPISPVIPASKKSPRVAPKQAPKPIVRDNPDSFARQVLVATNGYRRIHAAPPLQLSDKLNKMAKEWAEKLARSEKMEHGDKKNIGENIYCKTSSQPWFEMSGEEVVENWYSEVEDHEYGQEPTQGYLKTGHFTQLVWKDTKEMGVSFARNKNGHMAFVVAYFDPKGNWIGEFKEKVLPPGGVQKSNKKQSPKSINAVGSQSRTPIASPSNRKKTSSPTINYQSQISTGSSTGFKSPTNNKHRDSIGSPASQTSKFKVDTPGSITSRNNTDTPTSLISRSRAGSIVSFKSINSILTPTTSESRKAFSSPKRQVSKSAASVKSMMEENFYKDLLKAHNYYRGKHGVQPLRLNDKLTKFAQEWSDKIAKKDMMEHRTDNDYGENIYMKWSPNPNYKLPGEEAVDSWYEEISDYEFGKEPLDLSTGHFTQVIWADTKEVGVGVSKSKSGKIFVVANYDPPGNYIGQFSKKVPPPL